MSRPTKQQQLLDQFVEKIETELSVNFPDIARRIGADFKKDILPVLEADPAYKDRVNSALLTIRYTLADSLIQRAQGRIRRGVDATTVSHAIKLIDSGVLIGKGVDGNAEGGSLLDEHMKRLGV
jgi:hypothetical protein